MQTMESRKRSVTNRERDSTIMICSILQFLDASPARLLDGLPNSSTAHNFFKSFLYCVLSPDQSIRQLAMSVAQRLFTGNEGSLDSLSKVHDLGTPELRKEMWKQRQVVSLIDNCKALTFEKFEGSA